MAKLIEDYGLIGDCETAALVSRDGAIDWIIESMRLPVPHIVRLTRALHYTPSTTSCALIDPINRAGHHRAVRPRVARSVRLLESIEVCIGDEFRLIKGPEAEDHTLYASHTVWKNRAAFEVRTQSEAFRATHHRAGENKPLYLGHPQFEGFEVRQTAVWARPRGRNRQCFDAPGSPRRPPSICGGSPGISRRPAMATDGRASL